MKDYLNQLEFYTTSSSREESREYLEKYWLSQNELEQVWLPIKSEIYNDKFHWFPDEVFKSDYLLRPLFSGSVLIKSDFENLMNAIRKLGDDSFVIIEDYDELNPATVGKDRIPLLPLRFKFPSTITWDEIFSNTRRVLPDGIIGELFSPIRNYFVFGKSRKWGKYTANDHKDMVDVIGFKAEYLDVFRKAFPVSENERKNIEDSLPEFKNKYFW